MASKKVVMNEIFEVRDVSVQFAAVSHVVVWMHRNRGMPKILILFS